MKIILSFTLILNLTIAISAPFKTKLAYVSFYSELEDVKAENFSGTAELDTLSGKILFSFPIQSFYFDNATMQKHFNEKDVMDSQHFPRAKFVGMIHSIPNFSNLKENKVFQVTVHGNLTIKEITKSIETKAQIEISNGKIIASASFKLDRYEYGVNGKDGVISQILDIQVKAVYEKN